MTLKTLVIGLDGATWNLLQPLSEEGKLPTITQLMVKGCYGNLESCIPPVTFPAWKCYSSGKNPGKLGVYWWMRPDFQSSNMKTNSSIDFKGMEIWDYLNHYGITCGVLGMPTTYPVKEIKRFIVSELCTTKKRATYPKNLQYELEEKFSYMNEFVDYHGEDREAMLAKAINLIQQRFDAARYLAHKYDPDFLHLTVFHIDSIQHFFWSYMRDHHPKYGRVLEQTWKMLDANMGKLLDETKPEYVFIMSDHGFVESKGYFNSALWLLIRGYLQLKSYPLNVLLKFAPNLFHSIKTISNRLLDFILLGYERQNQRKLKDVMLWSQIDWRRSRIIAFPQGLFFFNQTHFRSNFEYERKLKYLLNKLQEVRHPITGKKAFAQVYRRTDIYTGEYIQNAPDIVVLPNEGFDVGANFNKLWYFPREEGWSAVHKLHGIFIATGPKIRKGLKIEGVKIYDLAPTIMHIFGLPIPSDIDGRVLKEIFETDSELSKKKPVYVDPIHYEKMNQSE